MTIESEQAVKELNPYLAAFEVFEQRDEAREPSWLRPLRMAGIAHFGELGFPMASQEGWRHISLAAFRKMPLVPAFQSVTPPVTRMDLERFQIEGLAEVLVVVNGRFRPDLSQWSGRAEGVRAGSLREALRINPEAQQHLGAHARLNDNAFRALNAAFFEDGVFIHARKNAVMEDPIHIINVSTAHEQGLATHPRNLIVLEQGARLFAQESFVSLGETPSLTNTVSEIVVGANARLEYLKVQDEHTGAFHFATVQAHLSRDAHYTATSVSNGARLSRHDINTVLDGEGVECVLNGLYLGTGQQTVDHHMVVDHARPHCASHEFFNGILGGSSRGVFSGKILVRKDAQKTDAKQSSRGLLLTNDATLDAQPQLEIFADDVKCTHGATVGQLDEQGIFYLRSRGIDEPMARRILTQAFGGEIINRIGNEKARVRLEAFLQDRLAHL